MAWLGLMLAFGPVGYGQASGLWGGDDGEVAVAVGSSRFCEKELDQGRHFDPRVSIK